MLIDYAKRHDLFLKLIGIIILIFWEGVLINTTNDEFKPVKNVCSYLENSIGAGENSNSGICCKDAFSGHLSVLTS